VCWSKDRKIVLGLPRVVALVVMAKPLQQQYGHIKVLLQRRRAESQRRKLERPVVVFAVQAARAAPP